MARGENRIGRPYIPVKERIFDIKDECYQPELFSNQAIVDALQYEMSTFVVKRSREAWNILMG